jgi:hypothetical protein
MLSVTAGLALTGDELATGQTLSGKLSLLYWTVVLYRNGFCADMTVRLPAMSFAAMLFDHLCRLEIAHPMGDERALASHGMPGQAKSGS